MNEKSVADSKTETQNTMDHSSMGKKMPQYIAALTGKFQIS